MELESIGYEVDGQAFTGLLADGSGGRSAAGILVAHEGAGLNAHIEDVLRRLAELGHVAFALDLFGGRDLPLEEAKAIVRRLRSDRAALRRHGRAALAVLGARRRVDARRLAAIGFCFGGTAVLELARDGAELACVVGFHPGLDNEPSPDARAFRAKVLVCCGHEDPVVSKAQRDAFAIEMTAAGVDWQMLLLGGAGHSFTNPGIDVFGYPGFLYDARADRRSWDAMLRLFDESFGTPCA